MTSHESLAVLKLPLPGPGRGPSPWDSQLRVSRVESGLQCPSDSLLLRETHWQDLPQDSLLQSRSEAPGTGPGLGNFKAGSESPDRCRGTGRPALGGLGPGRRGGPAAGAAEPA